MMDYEYWKKKIYYAIRNISDIDFQTRAWLGKGTEISSYTETIATLLDDGFFDDFLDAPNRQKIKIDDSLWSEMHKLKSMIYSYQEPESDSTILTDPKWHEIVEQAQAIIKLWAVV